jgi:hypothetical protein
MTDEKRTLRNESTPKGREIWKAVDKAAARAPEWMKKRLDAELLEKRESTSASATEEMKPCS